MHASIRIPGPGSGVSGMGPGPRLAVVAGRDGRFEIPCCDALFDYSLWAHLDDRSYATLAKSAKGTLLRRACLAANAQPRNDVVDLGDIRLDRLEHLELQALDAGGVGSACPLLLIQLARARQPDSIAPGPLALDHLGRGTLLAARGTVVRAAAGDDTSFACASLAKRTTGEVIVLRFPRCVTIAGRAVGERGQARDGVLLALRTEGTTWCAAAALAAAW
jgi:hypothetical protein